MKPRYIKQYHSFFVCPKPFVCALIKLKRWNNRFAKWFGKLWIKKKIWLMLREQMVFQNSYFFSLSKKKIGFTFDKDCNGIRSITRNSKKSIISTVKWFSSVKWFPSKFNWFFLSPGALSSENCISITIVHWNRYSTFASIRFQRYFLSLLFVIYCADVEN